MDNQEQTIHLLMKEISRLRDTVADLEAKVQQKAAEEHSDETLNPKQGHLSDFAAFAVENISDGVFLITKDARIVYVNRAACRQLGYTEEELLSMRIMDINPSVTREKWDSVWVVTVSDKIQTIETEHRAKDGRLVPVEVLANYFEFQGEQYSCSFTREITDRKRAEEALRESEERYRTLVQNIPQKIFSKDGHSVYLSCNENYARDLGIRPGEIAGRTDYDFYPKELAEKYRADDRSVMDSGATEAFEEEYLQGDAKTWIYTVKTPIRDKEGRVVGILGVFSDITERVQTENRLKKEMLRRSILMDRSLDGIAIINQEHEVVEANRRFAEMHGYAPDEVIGSHTWDWEAAMTEAEIRANFADLTKISVGFETRHRRKDGTIFDVEVSASGAQVGDEPMVFTITRDITERKKSEIAFRENEQFIRTVIDLVPHFIFVKDQQSRFLLANKAVADAYGTTTKDILGKSDADFSANREEAERFRQDDLAVINSGVPKVILQETMTDSVGGLRYLQTIKIPFHFGPERITCVLGVSSDITDRKLAEDALLISEEKYRLVVENANDAIVILQDGKAKFHNQQVIKLSGYSEEEITRVPFASFIHDADRAMVAEMHRKRLRGEDVPSIYSFRFMSRTGETRWVQVNAVLVKWEGHPAVLTFIRDITAEKRLEEQLLHAQKMEAIGTLAGGVAHDFNNLLMGILGYTSLMLMKIDRTHPFYEKLKIIEQQIESGAELTKQLLGFARGGKYEVKPLNVNDLLTHTSDVFGRTKKEITVHKKLREDLHTIEADRGQIEQVLFNLYVNAWQAMPSGGRLYLETENVFLDEQQSHVYGVGAGMYIKISVTDTGIGMDTETQKRIFEPFFTTKGIGKGTGLGLASAYGIIRNHGGNVSVYSEKGHGSAFTIYLPASVAKAVETKPVENGLLTGDETILIVDDEPINIEAVKELLEMLGYNTMSAKSGMEAVELYRKHSQEIELIILDMIMPEMNAKETLVKLMEIDNNVRVLLASGYSIDGEAKTILELGCKEFIQKPFRVDELSRKIRDVLDSGN